MAYYELPHIKIAAVASAVPTEVVKLESFAEKFGAEYVEKYKEQTGVKQFHKTREHQTASDLAFAAAENIITTKGIDRESIGALVFIAHSKDYWRPATACVLHKRLGLKKDCAAFDISLACSAVPYGMFVLGSLMESSDIERALLLVGETPQKITNPDDKSSCMLIGEGGGAFLLEKTDGNGAGRRTEPRRIVGILMVSKHNLCREMMIARSILRGDLAAGSTLTVDVENGELVCR